MIELFKDLTIQADLVGFESLKRELLANMSAPWSFLGDLEFTAMPGGKLISFAFRNGRYPDADLFVAWSGRKASISNVVPRNLGSLSKSQHNALLDDFYFKHLKPAADHLQLVVNISKAFRDIAEWIGPEAMRKLETFSSLAPKASTNHPADRKRWKDFVIAVQRNREGPPLPYKELERWLINDGWPGALAEDLAAEYSIAIEYLEHDKIAS